MTRAQAEEVLALGRAEIQKWVKKLTPVAGQNAVVEGASVSLMKPPQPPPPEVPVQTWVLYLFGSVVGEIGAETKVEIDIQNERAAHVVRSTLGLVTTAFWNQTQLLNTPQSEGPNLTRDFTLTLTARAIPAGETIAVESGWKKSRLQITLEEYDSSSDPTAGEVLDTITLTLDANGTVSRPFTQTRPGRITNLRPTAITAIRT